jgi:hypothetical protein
LSWLLVTQFFCPDHTGIAIFSYTSGGAVGALGAGLPGLPYPVLAQHFVHFGTDQWWLGKYSRLECMTATALEPFLPRHRRRSAITSTDFSFGDTPADVLRIQKEMSGYDCGENFDCLSPDGSGYYVLDVNRIGRPMYHGHFGLWQFRGQDPWSFVESMRWLMAFFPSDEPRPDVCRPGCSTQYSFPAVDGPRRRPLFASNPLSNGSSMPDLFAPSPPRPGLSEPGSPAPSASEPNTTSRREPFNCTAPDIPEFGSYLLNDWYDSSLAHAQAIAPDIFL